MQYKLPDIRSIDVKGKRVFLRSDLDAPIQFKVPASQRGEQSSKFKVEDDTRLVASLPTLEYLLKHGAKVILAGHLRRPEGYDPNLSLLPIAQWLNDHFKFYPKTHEFKYEKAGEFAGWRLGENIFLLENLRFHNGERKNDSEFTKKLASLAEMYVNDAFASSHRQHASIVGVPGILPHFAGIHLQKEVEILSKIMKNPKRPLVVIIGGAKIETKLPLIEKMHSLADYVLIGGKIADESRELLHFQHQKKSLSTDGRNSVLLVAELNEEKTDITQKSAENFLQIINLAKTIVWNGPLGKTENSQLSEEGSRKIALGIIKSNAYSIVGGGDTLEFLKKKGILNKFSFFSTGGGAMLSFLSGEKLPGIEALFSS